MSPVALWSPQIPNDWVYRAFGNSHQSGQSGCKFIDFSERSVQLSQVSAASFNRVL
jgi:hypothetical protein